MNLNDSVMAYIELKEFTKEEVLNILSENKNERCVIHFNCSECDDEQITYDDEVEEVIYLINGFKSDKDILYTMHIPCTNCGDNIVFLSLEYIQGIEILK